MRQPGGGDDEGVAVPVVQPYSFKLSMSAVRSFQADGYATIGVLRIPVMINGSPTVIEVSGGTDGSLSAFSWPATSDREVRHVAAWVLFADLDLALFYRLSEADARMGPIVRRLHGLKPTRPASLFEMVVIAITEQQLSLASSRRIQGRLIERFGQPVDDMRIFPEPAALAAASPDELRACGLSRQKAGYIHDLAGEIAGGGLEMDSLKTMDDNTARETIMGWRGFGRWSADYILVRGLARPDCLPVEDIGIRDVVGTYLGEGRRVTPEEVAALLEPFRPYRGLAAYYLLVHHRLNTVAAVS